MSWPSQFGDAKEKKVYDIHPSAIVPNLSFAFDGHLIYEIIDELKLDFWCNIEACEQIVQSMDFARLPQFGITFVGYSSKLLGTKTFKLGFPIPHLCFTRRRYPLTYELLVALDVDFIQKYRARLAEGRTFMNSLKKLNREVFEELIQLLARAKNPEAAKPRNPKEDIQKIATRQHTFDESLTGKKKDRLKQHALQILGDEPLLWVGEPDTVE